MTAELPVFLYKLLQEIAVREGFTDYTITAQPSNVGDGFQGHMMSTVINGTRLAKSESLVLICKLPPQSAHLRQIAAAGFVKEIYAYDHVLPEIVKFQREKGIVDSEGFFSFPKCYGTYANGANLEFAIVLEDLRTTGYRMCDRYKTIDYNHVRLAMAELGKFHAISFALREQKPDLFAKFKTLEASVVQSLERFPPLMVFFDKAYNRTLRALTDDDTVEKKMISRFQKDVLKVIKNASSGTLAEPFTVLGHGDFWNNNVMFRYTTDDPLVPDSICLIDWQMVQYCSPATDLVYYLYTTTEQALRNTHFDDILRAYHDHLAAQLQRLGGDACKQFSYDDLNEQLKRFGVYGAILAPMFVQLTTTEPENLPKTDAFTLDDCDKTAKDHYNTDAYGVRICDVMRDLVARGYVGDAHVIGD